MLSQLPLLIGLLVVAGACMLFLEVLTRRSNVGAIVILGVFLVHTASDTSLVLVSSPMTIFVEDLVYGAVLAAAVARFLRSHHLTGFQIGLIVFGLITVLALMRGMPEFGLQSSANEFRKAFRFVAAALYFSTLDPDRRLFDRIAMIWLVAAGAIGALTILRWGAMAAGLSGGFFGPGLIRAVPSTPTLVLVQGFFIALPLWRKHESLWLRHAAPVLLALVVLLQHRTVWVALIAGIAVWVTRDRGLRQRIVALAATALVAGTVLTFVIFDGAETEVADQLSDAATDTGTFSWRYEGWIDLLETSGPEDATDTLLGKPYGSGFGRQVDGQEIEVSPHSHYVETFLRQGAIGLAVLLLLYGGALQRLTAPSTTPGGLLSNHVLLVLLVTQLVHAIPYALTTIQGVPLGLALAAASATRVARHGRESTSAREPQPDLT